MRSLVTIYYYKCSSDSDSE